MTQQLPDGFLLLRNGAYPGSEPLYLLGLELEPVEQRCGDFSIPIFDINCVCRDYFVNSCLEGVSNVQQDLFSDGCGGGLKLPGGCTGTYSHGLGGSWGGGGGRGGGVGGGRGGGN